MILEAMKMENEISAPQDGTIASIERSQGRYRQLRRCAVHHGLIKRKRSRTLKNEVNEIG